MNLQPGITPLHLFIIIINTSFGAGMLAMPRPVADIAKEDLWLSVIVGGILFMFAFWAIVKLSHFFPEYTCLEYHRMLLGSVIGQLLNIILLTLLISLTAVSLRIFAAAIKMTLLDLTPPPIIVFTLLILAVYGTQYGLSPIMRMQQLVFMSNNLVLIPIILLGFLEFNADFLQPILTKGITPIIKGSIPSYFAYAGPELIIGLLYPSLTRQKAVLKWGTASIIALMIFYTLLTVVTQGILTPKETAHLLIPTFSAYREIEIPDTFVERVDGYLMILWIPLYFTSLINLFYFTSFTATRLLKLENNRSITILLVPLIYYLINLPRNYQTILLINNYYNMANIIWSLGIIPLLLAIAWLKEKRRSKC